MATRTPLRLRKSRALLSRLLWQWEREVASPSVQASPVLWGEARAEVARLGAALASLPQRA